MSLHVHDYRLLFLKAVINWGCKGEATAASRAHTTCIAAGIYFLRDKVFWSLWMGTNIYGRDIPL